MQITRLEVFGFKSFMERLILPLGSGITGVVGPNGCGKSNIVDAIRWVLGETRAKNLRGGVLEDVIFNGTDKLRPLGLAEVSVTIKADGSDFFEELVQPALEAELIAETAAAAIAQAKEENAAAKELAEGDAAAKPELKLVPENNDGGEIDFTGQLENLPATLPTASLLQKYSWLKSASEVQVTRRLYRSGESEFFLNRVPCRLKDLKDFFRAVGLSAKGFTIVAQGEVSQIVTAKPEQRRQLLEEAAGVQGFRDKINSARTRLEETRLNLSRIEDILVEVERQVSTLKRQASRAKNREELKSEIHRLDQMLYRHELYQITQGLNCSGEKSAQAREQELELERRYQNDREAEQSLRSQMLETEVQTDELRRRIDGLREDLNQRLTQRAQRISRSSELKAFMQAAENEATQTQAEQSEIEKRLELSQSEVVTLQKEEQKLNALLSELDTAILKSRSEQQNNLRTLNENLRSAEAQIQQNREAYVAAKTKLKTFQEQLASQSLPENISDLIGLNSTAVKSLWELIEVAPAQVKAVECFLKEKANYLVSENVFELAAKYSNSSESACFGMLNLNASPTETAEISGLTAITKFVKADQRIAPLISNLFAKVYFAADLNSALDYFKANKDSDITILTASGEMFNCLSVSFGASYQGTIGLRERVSDLSQQVQTLHAELDKLACCKEEILSELSLAEKESEAVRIDTEAKQLEARRLGNELGAVRGRIESSARATQQYSESLKKLQQRSAAALQQKQTFSAELAGLSSQTSDDQPERDQEIKAELEHLNVQYSAQEESRQEFRTRLQELSARSETSRNQLDTARQQMSDCSLELQRLDLEKKNLFEKVALEYEADFIEIISQDLSESCILSEADYADNHEQCLKLKGRLHREGEIDPDSIQRYEQESQRYADLENQKVDLVKASKALEETIKKLEDTSIQRFLETFNKVAENFSRIIPKLFGGGKGEIYLSDPTKPLDSGLEITARPPGKKLKSIELMSGGEKAMCATALIVSMFLVRPSPLCILDEVDAPLDEANLARFLGIIKEMSSQTQFMMITHNKQSMAVADRLVGVTMEQPGATKILSVSLQEAFTQVA